MQHVDKNGEQLQVGDVVRYGRSEGSVLLLETWRAVGPYPETAGCYVSGIGYWGDCRAVEAVKLERVAA
jgi:hypothetical protein